MILIMIGTTELPSKDVPHSHFGTENYCSRLTACSDDNMEDGFRWRRAEKRK